MCDESDGAFVEDAAITPLIARTGEEHGPTKRIGTQRRQTRLVCVRRVRLLYRLADTHTRAVTVTIGSVAFRGGDGSLHQYIRDRLCVHRWCSSIAFCDNVWIMVYPA